MFVHYNIGIYCVKGSFSSATTATMMFEHVRILHLFIVYWVNVQVYH